MLQLHNSWIAFGSRTHCPLCPRRSHYRLEWLSKRVWCLERTARIVAHYFDGNAALQYGLLWTTRSKSFCSHTIHVDDIEIHKKVSADCETDLLSAGVLARVFGRVLGGFWEGFGRVLGGFWGWFLGGFSGVLCIT